MLSRIAIKENAIREIARIKARRVSLTDLWKIINIHHTTWKKCEKHYFPEGFKNFDWSDRSKLLARLEEKRKTVVQSDRQRVAGLLFERCLDAFEIALEYVKFEPRVNSWLWRDKDAKEAKEQLIAALKATPSQNRRVG
jgi:hypothetical protein